MEKLLIVDLQKQFADNEGNYSRIMGNLSTLIPKYDEVFATVFSQNVEGLRNPNFERKLHWNNCLNCSEKDLHFHLEPNHVIVKNGYGIPDISKYFSTGDTVHIIGCDVDACVLAIAFQLWDLGCDFYVLKDYVYTTSNKFSVNDVFRIMRRNFGDCLK